ncbi:MAG: hypothetical protein R2748_29225 [Bryobacterales bacterium]
MKASPETALSLLPEKEETPELTQPPLRPSEVQEAEPAVVPLWPPTAS